jgi:hypothetical protein
MVPAVDKAQELPFAFVEFMVMMGFASLRVKPLGKR